MKTKEEQQKYADILKDFKETYIDHPENRAIIFDETDGTSLNCQYKADDGKKCAVGKYIPDDAYNPSLEGCTVNNIYDSVKYYLPVDDVEFWCELQSLHDDNYGGHFFDNVKKTFTEKGKLKYNFIVDFYCPDFQELKLV